MSGLYLLRIEEYEGEYNLGLAIVDRIDAKDGGQDTEDTWSISWFTRTAWKAKKEPQWGDNPVFEPRKFVLKILMFASSNCHSWMFHALMFPL